MSAAPRNPGANAATWRALGLAAALALAVFTVLFLREVVVASAARLHQDMVHDRLGGAIVDHVVRVHRGLPLYAPPDERFVPVVYTPLYYHYAALWMTALGEGVLACRAASVSLILASAAVAFALVRRVTGSWRWALLSVPIVAGGYPLCESFYDAPRVDPMSTLCVLSAMWVAAVHRGLRSAVVLGVLLAAAYFAKQSTLAFSAVLLLGVLTLEWRRALVAGLALAVAGGAALWIADARSDGWFWKYCVYLTTQHEFPAERVRQVLLEDAAAVGLLAVSLLGILPALWRAARRAEGARPSALVVVGALGVLAFSLTSHARSGATIKVLMPFGPAAAAAVPIAWAWLARSRASETLRAVLVWAALATVGGFLVQHTFAAEDTWPTAEDLARWDELHAEVERYAQEGQVWVAPWGYFTTPIEGQGMRPNLIALEDYLGVKGNDTGLPFPEGLARSIRDKEFVAIFCPLKGGNRDLRAFLREHYQPLDEAREMVVGTNRFTMSLGTFVPREEGGGRRRRR